MISAEIAQQLMVTVDNKVGTLAEITETVSFLGINLIAVCAYAVDNKGFIMFVSENNKAASKALSERGFDVREEEVVLVSLGNKPGALQALSGGIANVGIDLTLIYGSVDNKAKSSRLVLVSEDNKSVLAVIRMMK